MASKDNKLYPLTKKLKSYKIPTVPWKICLYNEYIKFGIAELSSKIKISQRSLYDYIFKSTLPTGTNKKNLNEYFKKIGRYDLIAEWDELDLFNKSISALINIKN